MSILTTILAHKEAQDCVDRHLPYWKAQTDKLIIFTPDDSRIETTERQISFGHACHHGAHAIERLYWLLTWLEGTDFNEFILHEYDSISFARPSVFNWENANDVPIVQGTWFLKVPPKGWLSSSFVHPPLAMRDIGLHQLVAAFGRFPFHAERGTWDRFIGLIIENPARSSQYTELPSMMRFSHDDAGGSLSFSHNTITVEHFPSLAESIKNGARHFHGVKSKETLDFILERIK